MSGRVALHEHCGRCAETGRVALLGELERCQLTSELVLPERLEACAVSGQRMVRDKMPVCAVTNAWLSPAIAARLILELVSDAAQLNELALRLQHELAEFESQEYGAWGHLITKILEVME